MARPEESGWLQHSSTAAYATDVEGRIVSFNAAALALWGKEPDRERDRWTGGVSLRVSDAGELPAEASPMAVACREARSIAAIDLEIGRPDGTWRRVLANVDPIRATDGRATGVVVVLIDVSNHGHLREMQTRLAAIVESSEDAIVSKDLNGVITSWNAGAEKIFGYSAAEAIGRPITILIPEDRRDEEPRILERIRRSERVAHYETIRRRKDGTLIHISLSVSPVRDGMGRIVGASKIARDITEWKRAMREVELARDRAFAASRARDDFLAALSHELRTPLNPVLLLASNATGDDSLPEQVRADFAAICRQIELEAKLIDDLLDLTRVMRGQLTLQRRPLDLNRLVSEAIAPLRADVDAKRLALTCELAPNTKCVNGDDSRLRQALWSILRNAIQYTPAGGHISVTVSDLPGDRVAIDVADSGVGMDGRELMRVFDAFARSEHPTEGERHRFGGLGFSLAVARQLVHLHGGTLRAASEGPGKGTIFTIELPLCDWREVRTLSTEKSINDSGESRGRVLLVEDHAATRAVLAGLLARRKFEVTTAGSLEEARQMVSQQTFDLLLSDIGLPDGKGHELMRELRETVKGIAITGYGAEKDIAQSRAAGFAVHLTKPVAATALDQALATVLGEEAATAPA